MNYIITGRPNVNSSVVVQRGGASSVQRLQYPWLTFQWFRDDEPIVGSTSVMYTPCPEDKTHLLKAVVTDTRTGHSTVTGAFGPVKRKYDVASAATTRRTNKNFVYNLHPAL